MTVAEEIAESKAVIDPQPTGQLTTVQAQKPVIPKTLRECRELAKRLAYNIVTGYVEHDRGHLDKSAEAFFQVYLRSEEHTSELQSPCNLVCRLLLEKKKKVQRPLSQVFY